MGARLARSWKNFVFRRASAFLVPGVAARSYFESIGVSADRVFEGTYCFDAEEIAKRTEELRKERDRLAAKMGIPAGKWCVLAVGKMIATRRYINLVRAVMSMDAQGEIHLIIVGDGPDYAAIRDLVRLHGGGNVSLLGGIPFSELAHAYALADVFVHPGTEPYSTATEFAALAALPIIATEGVGYTADLRRAGVESLIVEPGNEQELVARLIWTLRNKSEARALGIRARSAALRRNLNWAAQQLAHAIDAASSAGYQGARRGIDVRKWVAALAH
jgi:glycosyltransferase involved in cell wall biosynthesis